LLSDICCRTTDQHMVTPTSPGPRFSQFALRFPAIGSRASVVVVMVELRACRPPPRWPGIGCRTT